MPPQQLASARAAVRGARPGPPPEPASEQRVARVAVDLPLPHLDRPFDYLVPAAMADPAQPGVRVRVRFAGQLVDGFVLDRIEESDHTGPLTFLHNVVSPEPVLTPQITAIARIVADRYAGTLADVLRLAVPPRHARAEAAAPAAAPDLVLPDIDPGVWTSYDDGAELVTALRAGRSPRVVWSALPGEQWPKALAAAAAAALAGGRGSLIVVPDGHDVARVDAALRAALGHENHLTLTADLGPAERYRRFLAVRRAAVRVVVGTRAAMFAPVADLGLLAVWDDGDDLHAEPHAPYPHVRKVLALRSVVENAALLIGGFAQTAEGAQLLAEGWATPVAGARARVRAHAPRMLVAGDDAELSRDEAARTARLPRVSWQAAHDALQSGPVLVQVPRHGYAPVLACDDCRAAARCSACSGPLAAASGRASTACKWCGLAAHGWECGACGGRRLRAVVVGAARTAEELGRAFPRVRVRTSDRDGVLASVAAEPALVVATPGAEPVADGGYAAALLLDGWALLARPDLRAGEEAVRRWMNAAALVRPAAQNGVVVLMAEPSHPAVQALLRWDPAGYGRRELDERAALRLPPAVRMASLTGDADAVERLLSLADLPDPAEVLGPVPVRPGGSRTPDEREENRLLIRVPRAQGQQLVRALRAAAGIRSAHKEPGSVRLQIDPLEIA